MREMRSESLVPGGVKRTSCGDEEEAGEAKRSPWLTIPVSTRVNSVAQRMWKGYPLVNQHNYGKSQF